MKKIVEILNYIDFMDYMSKIKRYSYEVTKKGLIISTADLNIKLLVGLKNLSMENSKLKIFDKDFLTLIDDFNLNQCNKYIKNINEDFNQQEYDKNYEKQLNIF